MESEKIQNIIVFKQRNIGDVLMITPVLRSLKEKWPQARIVVVVNAGTEGALENNPDIAQVLVYQRDVPYKGFARLRYELDFIRRIRKTRFDLSISFTEGDRSVWYSLLCGARIRWGWVSPRLKPNNLRSSIYHKAVPSNSLEGHEVEKHYDLLTRAGLDLPVYPLRFVPPPEAMQWAKIVWAQAKSETSNELCVHVHPVSRWLWKGWEPRSMAQVIDWLQQERGARVVVTTGPNPKEAAAARNIVDLCRLKPYFIEGTCSLAELGALTSQANLFLGVDTGPMHFAAAVGTPIVALFGPTNPRSWRPWMVDHVVLQKPCKCNAAGGKELCDWSQVRACMADLSVAEVCENIDRMLKLGKADSIRIGNVPPSQQEES